MKPFRAVSYSMEKTETASFIHHHVLVKFFVFRQSYSFFASPEKSEIWTYDFCNPGHRYVRHVIHFSMEALMDQFSCYLFPVLITNKYAGKKISFISF